VSFTHFSFLLIEVIDHHTDEQIQREERAKDDEENEIYENVDICFSFGLNVDLSNSTRSSRSSIRAAQHTSLASAASAMISIHPLNVA
jgi:hypothetical protein